MSPALGLTNQQFQPCSKKPNNVSSMTAPSDPQHFIEPLQYQGTRDSVQTKLKAIIQSQPRTAFVTEKNDYWHVTFKTAVMRFTDDVEFYFPEGENLVHVRSASRVGYSDWGVNRKRVEALREALSNA